MPLSSACCSIDQSACTDLSLQYVAAASVHRLMRSQCLQRLARSLAKWETPADHFSAAAAHDGKESKVPYLTLPLAV